MAATKPKIKTVIVMNAQYWDRVHNNLHDAIDLLNKVTSRIAAHETNQQWELCDVIDYADTKIREARKLLESITAPF